MILNYYKLTKKFKLDYEIKCDAEAKIIGYLASTAAPEERRILTTFECPSRAARCNGVLDASSSSLTILISRFNKISTILR